MRILGIDPGLATLGWGVIDVADGRFSYVACGIILTKPDQRFQERLRDIDKGIESLVIEFSPDEIVFEELFFARNVTTALSVGAARGVAIACACRYTDMLFEYTPMQIKQAIVGYGRADKHQIQQMIKLQLSLSSIPKPDDAADALAAALTHAAAGRSRFQFRMK